MKYSSQGTRTGIAWRTFAKRNWEALLGAAGRAASGAMRGFVSLSVGKFARCSNVAHCRPSVRRTVIRLNSITRGCARVKVMTNGLGGEDLAAPAAEIESDGGPIGRIKVLCTTSRGWHSLQVGFFRVRHCKTDSFFLLHPSRPNAPRPVAKSGTFRGFQGLIGRNTSARQ